MRTRLLVLAALLAGAAACGDGDGGGERAGGGPATAPAPAEDLWTDERLPALPGTDQEVLVAAGGDEVVVGIVEEDGTLRPWLQGADGGWTEGEPLATGRELFGLTGAVRTGDGWVALGGELATSEVVVLRSPDGLAWEEVATTGLDSPADVGDVAVLPDGALVAVGTLRTDGPGEGGFVAVTWRSDDGGTTWAEARLPGGDDEGTAGAILAVGDRLLAGGSGLWASDDGGRTWAAAEGLPAGGHIRALVPVGDAVVATGMDGAGLLLARSTDGGRTWAPAAAPPPTGADHVEGMALAGGATRAAGLIDNAPESWEDPAACYADRSWCVERRPTALYTSADGDRWERVGTSGIALPDEWAELDHVAVADDGRVVALAGGEGGLTAWTWPAGTALPTEAEPQAPEGDVDLLEEGEELAVGERQGYPLSLHCGIDQLWDVNGTPWRRTDGGPDVETGAGDTVPEGWAAAGFPYGFVELVAPNRIEYSLADGTVIATYEPLDGDPAYCM